MFEKEIVDDVVEFVAFKLKEKNIEASEFIIQKLIFKIKMELGNEHELYDSLPYYWHTYGPVCEPITETITHFIPKEYFNK